MWGGRTTLVICLCALCTTPVASYQPPTGPYIGRSSSKFSYGSSRSKDLISHCKRRSRSTHLDHFSWATPTKFDQRYYVCSEHYKPGGPIFFYLGNEADVTLYLNNSGLMWELGPKHSALLVFAEHRYYGESKPFKKRTRHSMHWLTTEQAMADYAELIWELRTELGDVDAPVVGFGGSYGGMLAAWFRMKYPHLLDGAIAGSAPIWTFLGEDPAYDAGGFAAVVTRDASEEGGSAPACVANARAGWKLLFKLGDSEAGRHKLSQALGLCSRAAPRTSADVEALAEWLQGAWDYLAMGNYPYPSGYMLNGDGELPAYPVRVACQHLADPQLPNDHQALLRGLGLASGVFYNHSGNLPCFDWEQGANPEEDEVEDLWGYQACTEQFMPFSRDGENDMFWPQPFDRKKEVKRCQKTWGVTPRAYWPSIEWGGRRLEAASNIVFSNGLYDPWSSGGVLRNLSETLVAIIIPEGAHHLDLMFSHPLDPESVKQARAQEEHWIGVWVQEARARSTGERSTDLGAGANAVAVK
ncbi:hypothetical protein ACKKBG_A31535 [Auxenochlorella protothecoides x Auxenochlorella symbiontica]